MLKRYAPASVNYDAAQPAPIDAIHAGDQLRARGKKNEDGTTIDAVEVVSGTFRNISGVISAVDTGNSTVSLKDLATKKQMTIHITPDVQMRRIPDRMATMLAARLKGTGGAGAGGFQRGQGGTGGGQGGPPAGGPPQGRSGCRRASSGWRRPGAPAVAGAMEWTGTSGWRRSADDAEPRAGDPARRS